jgi:hypothetical protein
MAHIHFLTFGDGSRDLRGAAERIGREASGTGIFKSIHTHNLSTLRDLYPDFWRTHGAFIIKQRRGLGYWLWKPLLICDVLSKIRENDFLVYLDAGCEILPRTAADLIDLLPTEPQKHLTILPIPRCAIVQYTNSYCLARIDGGTRYASRLQIAANMLFIRNGAQCRSLTKEWLDLALADDYGYIRDRPDEKEHPEFIEHRHDQSIFSLLVYSFNEQGRIGLKVLEYNRPDWELGYEFDFPIRASRNRTSLSRVTRPAIYKRILRKSRAYIDQLGDTQSRYESTLLVSRHDMPNAKKD